MKAHIYLHADTLAALDEAATTYGLSRSAMVSMLVTRGLARADLPLHTPAVAQALAVQQATPGTPTTQPTIAAQFGLRSAAPKPSSKS